MPSDAATAALRDIACHIDLAIHFAAGFDADTFKADLRTVYAVTAALKSSRKRHAVCRTR
jgi:uncharacterized protein with HEPN domain